MRQNKMVVNCVDIAFETWYNNKNSRKGNGIMLVSADKKWDYALGIIKVDGLEPSPEFKNLIAKEKRGEMTTDDMRKVLDKKYKMKK